MDRGARWGVIARADDEMPCILEERLGVNAPHPADEAPAWYCSSLPAGTRTR